MAQHPPAVVPINVSTKLEQNVPLYPMPGVMVTWLPYGEIEIRYAFVKGVNDGFAMRIQSHVIANIPPGTTIAMLGSIGNIAAMSLSRGIDGNLYLDHPNPDYPANKTSA